MRDSMYWSAAGSFFNTLNHNLQKKWPRGYEGKETEQRNALKPTKKYSYHLFTKKDYHLVDATAD